MLFGSKPKSTASLDLGSYFRVNDLVRLEYGGRYFPVRVEDLRGQSIWVSWPSLNGVAILPREGETLTVTSSQKTGLTGFRGKLKARHNGPPATLELAAEENLGSVQRRDFVRIPDALTVWYRIADPPLRRSAQVIQTISKNISGGGMLLSVKGDHPLKGDVLELQIKLPVGIVQAKGLVVRSDPSRGTDLWDIGIRFTQINDKDQRTVVQHVFNRQTELRKAGLI